METNDLKTAYKAADYHNIDHLYERNQRRAWYRVARTQTVKELLRIGMYEWAMSVQLTSFALGDKLLRVAIHGETTKDQVAAIKELNKLLGTHGTLDPRSLKFPPAPQDELSKLVA